MVSLAFEVPYLLTMHRIPILSLVVCIAILNLSGTASAFWLLGFSDAQTLAPGHAGFIAGTGGQLSAVGHPLETSFTPFLPHAGFRLGLSDRIDVGYRLTQVALPFSSVGPSLGGELDVKYRLTDSTSPWQAAAVVGGAYSFLELEGKSRSAWSPGVELVASRALNRKVSLITELRYVFTAIPSAPRGSGENYLHAVGPDIGFKIGLTPQVSVVPEMGIFDFTGRIGGKDASGLGYQYGVVLSVGNLPALW